MRVSIAQKTNYYACHPIIFITNQNKNFKTSFYAKLETNRRIKL